MRIYGLNVYLIILLAGTLCVLSCRGKLTEEQQAEMQEGLEKQEIKRLTDQEIVQAALETGRLFRSTLQQGEPLDSLSGLYDAAVRQYHDTLKMEPLEKELWEAYAEAWYANQLPDENVQRAYPDYIYYTYPLIRNDSLSGMVSVRISRKQLILNY